MKFHHNKEPVFNSMLDYCELICCTDVAAKLKLRIVVTVLSGEQTPICSGHITVSNFYI